MDRLHPEVASKEGDIEAHRRAAHGLADAYDPVSWNLQTIMYARMAEPESYAGPGFPVIWQRVRHEAQDVKTAYDKNWRRILSDEPDVGRSVSGILHECTEVEAAVDRHGWTSHTVANKLDHLLTEVMKFQDEMSTEARRSVRV